MITTGLYFKIRHYWGPYQTTSAHYLISLRVPWIMERRSTFMKFRADGLMLAQYLILKTQMPFSKELEENK